MKIEDGFITVHFRDSEETVEISIRDLISLVVNVANGQLLKAISDFKKLLIN